MSLEADIHADPDAGCAADPLTGRDVLVVDETGIGCQRNAKLQAAVWDAGARLVTVGDACRKSVADNV